MTQEQQILNWLDKPGRSLTAIQALNKFGCFRLAARVSDLNKKGHRIQSEFVKRKEKRFSRYYLAF